MSYKKLITCYAKKDEQNLAYLDKVQTSKTERAVFTFFFG